jgi:transcriptional regulator with XRE-family HTH domain
MPLHVVSQQSADFAEIVRRERLAFAAKIRIARAVLGWSQGELAFRIGMTQRAVHKLEQGDTEPRRATMLAIETIWNEEGLIFEDAGAGGFRVTIRPALLEQPNRRPVGRPRRVIRSGHVIAIPARRSSRS